MAYVARYQLPSVIERGRDTAITCDVYTDAGAQQSPSAATVTLYDGDEVVVSAAAATSLGPPVSYTVTAATTSGRSLSDRLLAEWTLTIGGATVVVTVPAVLARRSLYPTITDTDLTDLHSDLAATLDTDNTATFEPYRTAAWVDLQRMIWRNGQRPYLVLDSWQLAAAHRAKSLERVFRDWAGHSLGDGRYAELAEHYASEFHREWSQVQFRYDSGEDGTIDGEETRAASPVTYLCRPDDRGWGWR